MIVMPAAHFFSIIQKTGLCVKAFCQVPPIIVSMASNPTKEYSILCFAVIVIPIVNDMQR